MLCPGCAAAEQEPRSGLCQACHLDRMMANRAQREREEAELRMAAWKVRLARAQRSNWVSKQERSRMLRSVRPRTPVPAGVDPLVMAEQALAALAKVRVLVRQRAPGTLDAVDLAAEVIRWLGWGPDNEADSEPAPAQAAR